MISAKDLTAAFARNLSILEDQTTGLTHADSLLQPPFRGNCMNWVIGHVAETHNGILQQLGRGPILTEAQAKRYGYGSEPVCGDDADTLTLDQLMEMIRKSQEDIASALDVITPEGLAAEVESFLGKTTLGYYLFFLYFHDTYHVGQTELLRQLAGTDDKVL